jgi:hypothetical protein
LPLRIVVALACWMAAALVWAGSSEVVSLPIPGKRVKHWARLELESRWVGGSGYRPIKVTIINIPIGPTTGDRDFRVTLTPKGQYYMSSPEVHTQAVVEMPEGSSRGTAWIAVPQGAEWQNLVIEVREGGDRIEELCEAVTFNTNLNYGYQAYPDAIPSVLFIDKDTPPSEQRPSSMRAGPAVVGYDTFNLPDVVKWHEIVPNDQYNRVSTGPATSGERHSDATLLSAVAQMDRVEILPPKELPDQWLHYTSLDIIFVPLDDAMLTRRVNPAAWKAILRWATAGGTLVISGAGSQYERLSDVENLTAMVAEPPGADAVAGRGGWKRADSTFYNEGRVKVIDNAAQNTFGYSRTFVGPNGVMTTDADAANQSKTPVSKLPFVIRPYGTGRVVAMAQQDPLANPKFARNTDLMDPALEIATSGGPMGAAVTRARREFLLQHQESSSDDMSWLVNQLEPRNYMGYQRTGVSYRRHNGDYMTFLVPGTGLVPVWSFMVLISAFVIVIGPINYMLLKQSRRLFMLLVTVPLGAAVITCSLFAYAVVSDGLGVRVRARSYTGIDQRTGQMASWSRQSYYAGLAPSGGLTFPADAAVYPIDEHPITRGGGRQRMLVWNDDQQQLRRGYMSSRQTAQFMVLCAGHTQRRLVFQPPQNGAGARVVNELGTPIEHLILRDKDGAYYKGEDIAADAEAALAAETYDKCISPISVRFNQCAMNWPEGYNDNQAGGGLWGFTARPWDWQYNNGNNAGILPPSYTASILERELQRTSTYNTREMEKGTYVALVASSPEVPLGYARVKQQASLHIIEGRW